MVFSDNRNILKFAVINQDFSYELYWSSVGKLFQSSDLVLCFFNAVKTLISGEG